MDLLVNRTSSPAEKKEERHNLRTSAKKRERRRLGRDRRRAVNEGLIVSLSMVGDRRVGERRQQSASHEDFVVPFVSQREMDNGFSVIA